MRYAMLIYELPNSFASRQTEDAYIGAWRAYYRAMVEAGIYIGGEPLELPETATTIRQKESKNHIQDGPYANTKEQLGGFIVIEVPSLDAALSWASRCPATSRGAVEVRPLAPAVKSHVTGEPTE